MKYPKEINFIIKNELTSLIEMKKSNTSPFNIETIDYYFNIYKNIVKNE